MNVYTKAIDVIPETTVTISIHVSEHVAGDCDLTIYSPVWTSTTDTRKFDPHGEHEVEKRRAVRLVKARK